LVKSVEPNHASVGLIGKEALGLLSWDEQKSKYHSYMAVPLHIPSFDWETIMRLNAEMESGTKTSFSADEIWTKKEVEQSSPWLIPVKGFKMLPPVMLLLMLERNRRGYRKCPLRFLLPGGKNA
jgi:hypothetical protein